MNLEGMSPVKFSYHNDSPLVSWKLANIDYRLHYSYTLIGDHIITQYNYENLTFKSSLNSPKVLTLSRNVGHDHAQLLSLGLQVVCTTENILVTRVQ